MHAVKRMPEVMMEALKANGKSVEDVDFFLLNQANLRINDMAAKTLKVSPEKVFNTIQKYGNTTAATIAIGADEAIRAGKLEKGDLVMTSAFGSGFTWASCLIRW